MKKCLTNIVIIRRLSADDFFSEKGLNPKKNVSGLFIEKL